MSGRRIQHGKATVSWGPRAYGVPKIIANCPVENIADLVTAVAMAADELAQDARHDR